MYVIYTHSQGNQIVVIKPLFLLREIVNNYQLCCNAKLNKSIKYIISSVNHQLKCI